MRRVESALFSLLLALMLSATAHAQDARFKPYILASSASGTVAEKVTDARTALEQAGYEIAGEYTPYEGVTILIATSAGLKKSAAESEMGGYGAVVRVSVTQNGENVEVSYTNPQWMANVYRLSGDGSAAMKRLNAALGMTKDFGSEGGRSPENLRKYHYMMFMPYFDDQVLLAEYPSQGEAIKAVNAALAAGKGGTSKVYQVDLDGKDESLIGVALTEGEGADATVMGVTDQGTHKHSAHLPYEMLISGGKVYMLHGKFRIAQSFPDLTMGTFMKISGAPDAIETSMRAAAGN